MHIGPAVRGAALLSGIAWTLTAPAQAATRKPARKPAGKTAAKTAARKPTAAPLPAALQGAKLEILPASATLDGPRAVQHLIVSATAKDGATYDVTDRATLTAANPRLLKIADGKALPVSDGETTVVAKLGGLTSTSTALKVVNAKAPAKVEFVNDVMPILARAGCNSTACHGSPVGKGGFKLSLFGYEPDADYVAIAKDASGKRIDPKDPAKSLFLTKAIGAVAHGGGMRFKAGSPEYTTILTWLKDGAEGIGEFETRVKQVQVLPEQPWMPRPDAKQRLAVTAVMSDGSTRDVTDKVLFSSNDDAIAAVEDSGLVTAKRAGETAVMVRFMGQVAISRVAVLPNWKIDHYPTLQKNNFIDELVQAKLQKLRMVPSDLCSDEEFVRRVSLDVSGIIPSPEDVVAFVQDRNPNKRAALIDKLLDSSEHVDLWTMKWNDTLRNNPRLTRVGVVPYANWIREQIAKNRPYDEFVRDLLTASGRTTLAQLDENDLPQQLQNRPGAKRIVQLVNSATPNPAASYYVIAKDPLDVTSATSQIFLGVRIECARCHNHPFEKWTQSDYYGLAAFLSGIQSVGGNQVPNVVSFNPRGRKIRHPKTNEVVEPRVLDNADIKVDAGGDLRKPLADWITSPENPWFSKALANRVWGHYFGRGIVEPVDDFRVTNPASNPELLDALGKDFAAHKFDVKALERTILNSRTYQQSSKPNGYNQQDASNFARFYPKRMMAEQLYDSISQATDVFPGAQAARRRQALQQLGVAGKYAKFAQGAQAEGVPQRIMQMPALVPGGRGGGNPAANFLNTFGKPRREVVCECERSNDGNIGQALVLMNGQEVNQKIAAPSGRVQTLIRSGKPDDQVITELYLAALARKPDVGEMNDALSLIRSGKSRNEGVEDVMWGLLNSREFLFIH